MIIFKTVADYQLYLQKTQLPQASIGFVPTMGALHNGHLALVQACKQQHPVTVVSIFVNPTQFNDPKDFEKYPITIEQDCKLLEQQGADILFLPSVAEMYPQGMASNVHYNLGHLETVLEGAFRPGHFQGVCQVVQRLLEIVQPGGLFIGQKDFRQCMVLKRLIELMQIDTQLTIVPTLREADGLAMSSRNVRLSAPARQQATIIYKQLQNIKQNITVTNFESLQQEAIQQLKNAGFNKIDYVELANANNLEVLQNYNPNVKSLVLVAAFVNEVRLIDNMLM